jgi:hypothetical protein
MTFRIGQKITRVGKNPWPVFFFSEDHPGPQFGDVLVVSRVGVCPVQSIEYVVLVGFKDNYGARCFRPVVEPKAELPAEITALLDVKNHTPLPGDVPGREAFV